MNKSTMNFVKGVGAGMAAGIVVAAVGSTVFCKSNSLSKTTKKAAKAVSNIVDSVQSMIK